MMALVAENLAPIMFLGLIAFLLLGYPVAFSLGAVGLLFFVIGVELAPYSDGTITLSWPLLNSMPGRIFEVMRNDTLLAIPFFTFMGLILERSGMAEDLLETIGQLFGTIRGGLAYAVIFVGALLAATTGVVAASVISMGLISLPIMLRYGYDRRLASGTIAASGTLAQIIPPSLVLIVLADQLGRSVDDMYKGAILPGIALAGLYAVYVFIVSMIRPAAAPGLPPADIAYRKPDGSRGLPSLAAISIAAGVLGIAATWNLGYRSIDYAIVLMGACITIAFVMAVANRILASLTGTSLLSPLAERVTFVMVPPLLLIFLVLGTIIIGLATPTEGGAMGAVGALLLAGFKRFAVGEKNRLDWKIVGSAAEATAKLSAFVMFILIGARIFSLTFYGINGHVWVEHLLTSLPGGMYGFLVMVMVLVFVLAFFLDFFELAFILVPLLKPAAEAIFRTSPEAVAIAKSFGFAVIAAKDPSGVVVETVADVTPFMIWFGVLMAINMQTSFMHPPFGFALFYLRSVAPKEPYVDRVTGRTMNPVQSSDIYWGAVPFVGLQLSMIAIVMAMPWLAMHAMVKSKPAPTAIERTAPPDASSSAPEPLPVMPGSGDKRPFALPPEPPAIPGAVSESYRGPPPPTLDMSQPPRF
ncbi:MAG: TRAP transporter large permease subunit [Hyphomicrobium sp.]|nr:TRAP transporter large permease subunit [Hyphomicrobium sp.]